MSILKSLYSDKKKEVINSFTINDLVELIINSDKFNNQFEKVGIAPKIFTHTDNELRDMVKAHINSLTSVANLSLSFGQQTQSNNTWEEVNKRIREMWHHAVSILADSDLCSYSIFCDFGTTYKWFGVCDIDEIHKYITECINKGLYGTIDLQWHSMCDSGFDASFKVINGKLGDVEKF